MFVYDNNGKEYKVDHKIDVKEWLEAGYLKEKPKEVKKRAPRKTIKKDN